MYMLSDTDLVFSLVFLRAGPGVPHTAVYSTRDGEYESESSVCYCIKHYHIHIISSAPKSLFHWKGISHPEDTIEDLDMCSINGVRRVNVFEDKRYTKHLRCEIRIYRMVSDELFEHHVPRFSSVRVWAETMRTAVCLA